VESSAPQLEAPIVLLGTDGFGRSDTRRKLRQFFEIDHIHIALAAMFALARAGAIDRSIPGRAFGRYSVSVDDLDPWSR
jgi:pyruvate dehydrogenase E1 component